MNLKDDEHLFCADCGDEARYSRVGKTSVIVFGHMGRKRQDHPVRLAPLHPPAQAPSAPRSAPAPAGRRPQ